MVNKLEKVNMVNKLTNKKIYTYDKTLNNEKGRVRYVKNDKEVLRNN